MLFCLIRELINNKNFFQKLWMMKMINRKIHSYKLYKKKINKF
jgi:hypothetical protein